MSNKQSTEVLSSIMRCRDKNGLFVPIFPINTANEVYVDIDNDIKLSSVIGSYVRYKETNSIDTLYNLTQNDVKLSDIIKVLSENRYFLVVDINNLNSDKGYLELITSNNNTSVEFITYTADDIRS